MLLRPQGEGASTGTMVYGTVMDEGSSRTLLTGSGILGTLDVETTAPNAGALQVLSLDTAGTADCIRVITEAAGEAMFIERNNLRSWAPRCTCNRTSRARCTAGWVRTRQRGAAARRRAQRCGHRVAGAARQR